MTQCPRCQQSRAPWVFYAALILAAVCVGSAIRLDLQRREVREEYKAVRAQRVRADSLLADWSAKRLVPYRGPWRQQ